MQKKQSSCSANWSTRARLAIALAAASSLAQFGCNTSCDNDPKDNPPEIYVGGKTSGDDYESSPTTSGLLPFPGGKQFFLVHHLGFTPALPTIYFGLSEDGIDLNPCSGNTCLVPCVNSEFIWIRNDTCTDFLVHVETHGRSPNQNGTLCPGGAFVSITGAGDASIEVTPPLPDSSEASVPITSEAATEAPAD
jgi:hypothetical protein